MAFRPNRVSADAVERNMKSQRQLEVRRQQLASFATENSKLLSAAHAQEKIEIRRSQATQSMIRNEQLYEQHIMAEERDRHLKQKVVSQNSALAAELSQQVSEDERKRKEIQRICDESPELRDLEKALKIAYLNKERAAQHEERILLAAREQKRIQVIEEQMEYDRLHAMKNDAVKLEAKKLIYKEQRAALQQQIEERKLQLVEAQRQEQLDREMVDNIVRKINEEDEDDFRKKREMQAATAKMIRDYEEQRRREVAEARAREKAEEERISSYNKSVEARTEGEAARKLAKRDDEERILKKIVEDAERKRLEEEEFNNLRDMLWEEELEAKRASEEKGRIEKQREAKREMMDVNAHMLKIKAEMRSREAETEAKMLILMRRKFAEDEARERLEAESKALAKKNYMSLIEKQKMENRALTEQQRAQEIAEAEIQLKKDEYKKRIVQEARKRLLQEHAAKLQGFLPPGVIESKEDFEIIARSSSSEDY